ncbi:DUF4124 domain-containing protein [Parahaliea aestuarii]|uniref:DUF4124 domain-containing protein n=1 Tax=Parahaliea aestuarii TaxID=1852021 RepID=A0A5C8ZYN0_9GAMM|nr:DUF4124 domain-containing protein [Parahaliea aestuarii]TXS92517.1 DUF4124 domain-containing protein [Parahaliea aestuarii]
MRCYVAHLLGAFTLYSAIAQADTATVYKTVDENGVVSFSDSPPAAGTSGETLEFQTAEPGADSDYQQHLEHMRETTDRMAADRREREQHRAELLRQQAERQAALAASEQASEYDDLAYPGGYGYPYPVYLDPPRRPHHQHRPHPRPPLAKPPQGVEGLRSNLRNNSQLMRPMLPRRSP